MDEYAVNKQPCTYTSYRNSFKNISRCPEITDACIGDISKRIVHKYAHAHMKQDKVSGATGNREISMLQSMLSYAVTLGFISFNPLDRIDKMRESGKRDVNISVEQIQKLIMDHPRQLMISWNLRYIPALDGKIFWDYGSKKFDSTRQPVPE